MCTDMVYVKIILLDSCGDSEFSFSNCAELYVLSQMLGVPPPKRNEPTRVDPTLRRSTEIGMRADLNSRGRMSPTGTEWSMPRYTHSTHVLVGIYPSKFVRIDIMINYCSLLES